MHFQFLLVSLAVASGAFASPLLSRTTGDNENAARDVNLVPRASSTSSPSAFTATPISGGCLSDAQATAIVAGFNYLLLQPSASNFASTADAILSDNFTDTSDSINQLTGAAEGSITFDNKAAFIASSGTQPALNLATIDMFHTCDKIVWRWASTGGTGDDSESVKGIDVFEVNNLGQINSIYAEFNSGAWLKDLGYPECKK